MYYKQVTVCSMLLKKSRILHPITVAGMGTCTIFYNVRAHEVHVHVHVHVWLSKKKKFTGFAAASPDVFSNTSINQAKIQGILGLVVENWQSLPHEAKTLVITVKCIRIGGPLLRPYILG